MIRVTCGGVCVCVLWGGGGRHDSSDGGVVIVLFVICLEWRWRW